MRVTDRREAICNLANETDVILVAGKGHEDYQEIQGEKHFDDKNIKLSKSNVVSFLTISIKNDVFGAGVFQYISFRAGLAVLISLLITITFGQRLINLLKKLGNPLGI